MELVRFITSVLRREKGLKKGQNVFLFLALCFCRDVDYLLEEFKIAHNPRE